MWNQYKIIHSVRLQTLHCRNSKKLFKNCIWIEMPHWLNKETLFSNPITENLLRLIELNLVNSRFRAPFRIKASYRSDHKGNSDTLFFFYSPSFIWLLIFFCLFENVTSITGIIDLIYSSKGLSKVEEWIFKEYVK